MGLNPVVVVTACYLLLGAGLLILFDAVTKRIRTKLTQAVCETQSRLFTAGNYVGSTVAFFIFLGAMWLFWPMVFIGALTDKTGKREGSSHGS